MKSTAALVLLACSANAFSPSVSVRTCSVSLYAKHANNKAAKKANHNRPRKSRPSDINRKPVVYDEIVKPPEYTIIDESYVEAAPKETHVPDPSGQDFSMIMNGDEHIGWMFTTGGSPQGTFEAVDWTKVGEMEGSGHQSRSTPSLLLRKSLLADADDNAEWGAASLEDLGLPADATLIDIVDDKVLVFE